MPTKAEMIELACMVERQTSPRAKLVAKLLVESTSLGFRFDLTDPRKLEKFLIAAMWVNEHEEISLEVGIAVPLVPQS